MQRSSALFPAKRKEANPGKGSQFVGIVRTFLGEVFLVTSRASADRRGLETQGLLEKKQRGGPRSEGRSPAGNERHLADRSHGWVAWLYTLSKVNLRAAAGSDWTRWAPVSGLS